MKFFNPKPTEMPERIAAIEEAAGYHFKDQSLLVHALVHSSFASEEPNFGQGNERLEYLGDAVLQLVITRGLFLAFPERREGELTRDRSLLVDENANAKHCVALKIDQALLLGRGENMIGGRQRKSLLGDAFEAFLGAVFLDGGLEAVADVVNRLVPCLEEELEQLTQADNPKGVLQNYCQAKYHCPPAYRLIGTSGASHSPVFEVEVLIHGTVYGQGQGPSKKAAERAAAQIAIAKLKQEAEVTSAENTATAEKAAEGAAEAPAVAEEGADA